LKDGVFNFSQGQITNGCFGQLMIEINGDNSVAAIYIKRNSLRGCISANYSYPGGLEGDITYSVNEEFADNVFRIIVCSKWIYA